MNRLSTNDLSGWRSHFEKRTCFVGIVGFALWGSALMTGLAGMSRFSLTPGSSGKIPANWPEQSSLSRQSGVPTILLFAHPRCPCTTASLEQLKPILAKAQVAFRCYVVFLNPPEADRRWRSNTIVDIATTIPSVEIVFDSGGESQRFGVGTSGHVLLYDASGDLKFSGGITVSRGHLGECDSASDFAHQLNCASATVSCSPTFGCPLFQDSTVCREIQK